MNIKKVIKGFVGGKVTKLFVDVKYGLFNLLCGLFPMNDEIIFESHPDFTCNAYAVYRHMLQQGVNQKYKLTWMVREPGKYTADSDRNLDYLPVFPKGIAEKIRTYIRCNRAKAVVTCHTHVSSMCVSPKQINLFLDHGSHLKNCMVDNKRFPLHCGYLNCQSEFFVPLNVSQYTVEEGQVISLGLPRNDLLFENTGSISRLVSNIGDYSKVILWAPTFRRHHGKERVDCDLSYPLGLPILYSEADAEELNRVLTAESVLLIIKPHPSSDMSVIKEQKLSNVMFLYNSDLDAVSVQLNELLAQTDAMITDYSSIYYDYLLVDRPLALTLDDYDAYASQKGFVFDEPLDVLRGQYLYNVSDMCGFVTDVAQGIDRAREERLQAKNLVHFYQDDKSSERVSNFILEKLSEA